ncbi:MULTISPECIES: hypothetical protein [unclassified Butyrivibrio]|uniref:hypothetical protein n=1 Tax=unclassified Butyrivibrio TaxID=2639466 RepID=UPI0003FE2A91|nr:MULTISPECIES: hypothetical protein [unclassified Butyrivibrio]MCR4831079.1 hypothetical protein [Pseudobutyrivibrio sp.]
MSRVVTFPDRMLIDGFVYEKQGYNNEGGVFYNSKDNPSDITSKFISLYPDGKLTYLYDGLELIWNKDFKIIN